MLTPAVAAAEDAVYTDEVCLRGARAAKGVSRFRLVFIFICVWIISAGYAGANLRRGWVPHDEGTFAQSADRVLHGELPHRDYAEIYTGGLSYVNALAFKYFGEDFATLRFVLFAFFLAWVPVFYWIASRFAPDWVAGATTLLAVVWSVPNYSAPVPSWYGLFFATFGLAALLAYTEKRSAGWLFAAGLAGGLSFLAKSTALFYVAGVLLFFLFSEQRSDRCAEPDRKARPIFYISFAALSIFGFVAVLARLVHPLASIEEYVDFVLPATALATVILAHEWRPAVRTDGQRFLSLFKMCGPFGLGFIAPVIVFLIPYVRRHSLHALVNGVFVLPFKRLSGASMPLPDISTMAWSLSLAGCIALATQLPKANRWMRLLYSLAVAAFVVHLLISSGYDPINFEIAWNAAYWLAPVVVVAGALTLCLSASGPRSIGSMARSTQECLKQEKLFLILAVTALCTLVQFPFSAYIYFCYTAPLVILAALALLSFCPVIPKTLLAIVFAGFLFFGAMRVQPSFIYSMGSYYQPDPETGVLDLPRGGHLRIEPGEVQVYDKLIPLIQRHAGTGEIYAGPDAPQIYFLAKYKNLTPTISELFQTDAADEQLLKLVDSRPVRVIVLNSKPAFTPPLSDQLHKALLEKFSNGEQAGDFEVRWR